MGGRRGEGWSVVELVGSLVLLVTNLPGAPDSKVTELLLDKQRSPASISYPVLFGNTWLFLGARGLGEGEGEERPRETRCIPSEPGHLALPQTD